MTYGMERDKTDEKRNIIACGTGIDGWVNGEGGGGGAVMK